MQHINAQLLKHLQRSRQTADLILQRKHNRGAVISVTATAARSHRGHFTNGHGRIRLAGEAAVFAFQLSERASQQQRGVCGECDGRVCHPWGIYTQYTLVNLCCERYGAGGTSICQQRLTNRSRFLCSGLPSLTAHSCSPLRYSHSPSSPLPEPLILIQSDDDGRGRWSWVERVVRVMVCGRVSFKRTNALRIYLFAKCWPGRAFCGRFSLKTDTSSENLLSSTE